MEKIYLLTLWLVVLALANYGTVAAAQDEIKNDRPIIGILSQDLGRIMASKEEIKSGNYSSYIAASYVKFVEAAGARVVPIFLDQKDSYYKKMVNSLNGFIFPGGGAKIDGRSGYGRTGKKIYSRIMKKANQDPPVKIPLWGTCLGFEMLALLAANDTYPLTRCNASNKADTLQFQEDFKNTDLFKDFPPHLITALKTENITSNFHKYCVLPETFYQLNLDQSFYLLSTTEDFNEVEYISTIEHKFLPIFGTQWHPEKAAFEWAYHRSAKSIPHSPNAIQVSQKLAEKFVQEARKNSNSFKSEKEARDYLIYNYVTTFVQPIYYSSFQTIFFFKDSQNTN